MVKYGGDSQECRLLSARIRHCEVVQTLAVNSADALVHIQREDEKMGLLASLAPRLSWKLQSKLCLVHALSTIEAFEVDLPEQEGEMSQEQREGKAAVIAEAVMPSMNQSDWDIAEPSMGCLLHASLARVESATEAVAMGHGDEVKEQDEMDNATSKCSELLEARHG